MVLSLLRELNENSGIAILMATHEQGRWVFNPGDDHMVRAGHAIVIMANPGGRETVEEIFRA